MARRPATARSGMALILTLSAIVLAGGLALLLQARAAGRVALEKREWTHERLRIAAAEAAREALFTLASDEDLAVDHLGEDWADVRAALTPDGISTLAQVEDAGRFYNWNHAVASNGASRLPRDILLDLLSLCGDLNPVIRVEALGDFLDEDGEGTYEAAFYQALTPPYAPADRLLWAPAELMAVHGFSVDLFAPREGLDSADLFGGDLNACTMVLPVALEQPVPININTANHDVLLAMTGLEQEAAIRALLALRHVQPFESLAALAVVHPGAAATMGGTLSVRSDYFRVRARAALEDQHHTVQAWVHRDEDGDVHILQWVEGVG
ncbi:MAG: general secretion pathway protein GspK [Verrucomicrobiota bacterium]|jgi:type II secretory pathway component PulK|nr:general secretion pathway protein GspK [Verrucomicrobiota bacterium]